MSSPTAVDVQGAYLLLEQHRSAGHHQAPRCRACGLAWPCRPRLAATAIIQSVYADAWAGRP